VFGSTGHLGAQCGGEAKVSIERIGPQGTSAEGRLGSSAVDLAVTLTLTGSCWAAGDIYLSAGPGPQGSEDLRRLPKNVS
jgi:hypothetical protein